MAFRVRSSKLLDCCKLEALMTKFRLPNCSAGSGVLLRVSCSLFGLWGDAAYETRICAWFRAPVKCTQSSGVISWMKVVAFPPGFPITVLSWRRGDDSQLLQPHCSVYSPRKALVINRFFKQFEYWLLPSKQSLLFTMVFGGYQRNCFWVVCGKEFSVWRWLHKPLAETPGTSSHSIRSSAGMLAIQVPPHTQLLLTTLPGKGLSGLGWVLIFGVVSKEEMWMWSACKARRLRVPDRNGGWPLNFCFCSNCACTELQPAFPAPWYMETWKSTEVDHKQDNLPFSSSFWLFTFFWPNWHVQPLSGCFQREAAERALQNSTGSNQQPLERGDASNPPDVRESVRLSFQLLG